MAVTRALSEFVATLRYPDVPPEVAEKCKLLVLDCMGNQIGACGEAAPTILYDTLEISRQAGASSVVGWGTRVSAPAAALMNGMLAHTLDMDDAHRDSLTKTGSAITPAAFAVGQAVASSGAEVLAAVVAGYEVMIRLGLAVNPSHRKRGFHSTATLGAFGSAAAAGRLLGLSPEQQASAFGIAGTQASGLVAFINNPSMIKAFNVGRGVQNGVTAALLARDGFVGPPDIFEHEEGFFAAYADTVSVERVTAELGRRFRTLESGFKPHAACRYAHGPIDAALGLIEAHAFAPAAIEHIDVFVSELAYRQSNFHEPKNVTSAQGSTPFSIAAGITRGVKSLTVRDVKAAFEDQAAWELHRRIRMHVDGAMDYMGRGCRMTLELQSGAAYEVTVDLPRGEPENPMSAAEVSAKFHAQAQPIIGAAQADTLASMIGRLESVRELDSLMLCTERNAGRANLARTG